MKKKVKLAFVILCYRETSDVVDLIKNLENYREDISILIVNSYYDDVSKDILKSVANKYDCDFLNIENKGYGYGNNRGIEFINKNYEYDFICISNPDVIFNNFSLELLENKYLGAIVAPNIITKSGKRQNPYYYYHLPIIDSLKFIGLVKKIKLAYYLGVLINKTVRLVMDNFNKKNDIHIYACHGSCFFIGNLALEKLGLPYNEKMFLFHEEEHLARLAKKNGIPIFFQKQIAVTHYEDGSSESISDSTHKYMQQSFKEYY